MPRFVRPRQAARPAPSGRRRFLKSLAALVLALPLLRAVRVRAEDYVEADGWILKRSDLGGRGGLGKRGGR